VTVTRDPGSETVTTAQLIAWFRAFSSVIEEGTDELTRLDSAIGDGDHGTNMRRGCRAVLGALDADPPADVAGFGRAVAMKLISAVGGASGPLYGSFFLAFGTSGGTVHELDPDGLAAAWRAGADAVASRGKAARGDKTILDAMFPAVEALEAGVAQGSLEEAFAAAVRAADDGVEATIPMEAHKGRASYLGERSIGHQDPGATSTSWLVRTAAEAVTG
jgi:phosphoenolpyruvate---glycerone phosphotransferase subunit DhaL